MASGVASRQKKAGTAYATPAFLMRFPNMQKKLLTLCVVTFASGAFPQAMADKGTRYTVMGHGLDSCGEWIEGRQQTQKGQEANLTKEGINYTLRNSWLAGYLTAVNRWFLPGDRGAERSMTDGPDTMLAWMDNYCVTHPSENLDKAAEALAGELSGKWLKAHPPRLTELETAPSPQSGVQGSVAHKDDK